MVNEYPKGADVQLSEHFHLSEFDCHCRYPDCQITYVDTDLVEGLEASRAVLGPIAIESGFRCTRHNKKIGGKKGSYHLQGKAADPRPLKVSLKTAHLQVQTVPVFRNGGIGYGPDKLHVDVRGYPARWEYP